MKKNRLNLNGVIIIDKPKGMSSNRILQKLKYLYNAQKAGHTGTLDPMATGVLPICFGRATKIAQYLLDCDKEYVATIQLGAETDSGDAEGETISQSESIPSLNQEKLESVLDDFRGQISQVPPMFSALKHNGQPLYKLARKGEKVEIKPRLITIYELKLLAYTQDTIEISVRSSKGTYIRSLAIDIGKKLGCGGHLSALRRTKSGPFSLDDSYQIEQLNDLTLEQKLATINNVEQVFLDKPIYSLTEQEKYELYNKGRIEEKPQLNGVIRLFDKDKFVAIAEFDQGILINKKFFDQEIISE